jgi:hypothetical protein
MGFVIEGLRRELDTHFRLQVYPVEYEVPEAAHSEGEAIDIPGMGHRQRLTPSFSVHADDGLERTTNLPVPVSRTVTLPALIRLVANSRSDFRSDAFSILAGDEVSRFGLCERFEAKAENLPPPVFEIGAMDPPQIGQRGRPQRQRSRNRLAGQ